MMKMMMQAVFLFCCWAALLLGGCGYKNLPVAPQTMIPRPVTDLSYELTGKGVVLHWTYPDRTATDSKITELDSFLLYRAELPADAYCDTCPIPFRSPISLPGGLLPDKGHRQGSYEDAPLQPGYMYFFKLRSRNGWLAESEDSNVVSFVWENPPAAPAGLTAEAGERQISLRWQPVTRQLDGRRLKKPIQYQVTRSTDGGPFETLGGLLTAPSYTDKQTERGRNYVYRVQALVGQGRETAGSGFSKTVEAGTVDRTPPQIPAHVKAARTATLVKIYWDKGTDKDLAGHRIYRRIDDGAAELIGEVREPYNLFEDKNPPVKDSKAWYSVSSFDQSSPANESQRSAETRLR